VKLDQDKASMGQSEKALGHGVCKTNLQVEIESNHFAKVLPFLEERITFKIPSHIDYLDFVLEYLNGQLVKFGIVRPGEPDILIALDEAIVNAIKHGNRNDPQKQVCIVADMSAHSAKFTVKDQGPGFEYDQLPDPTDPSRLLIPSGRGLLLIKHIMDDVQYNDRGNEIRMVKTRRRPQI
jgi:serine/threonine-protein kinase RsbW